MCRHQWEAVRVLQLFLEHVLLKHDISSRISYLERLMAVSDHILRGNVCQLVCVSSQSLGFHADFTKVSTLIKVKEHLEVTEKDVKRRRYDSKAMVFIIMIMTSDTCAQRFSS
jgi:hypothetical protein